jgi:recombination protein RecA
MGSLLDLGLDHKVLEKKGAWIAFNGELVGQGREAAKDALKQNAQMAEKIKAAVLAKAQIKPGDPVTGEAQE